jgi:hypothetical protein
MSDVLRSHLDVIPRYLTEALRRARWIPDDVTVIDAGITTIGAGQMGICARYDLRFDHDVTDVYGVRSERGDEMFVVMGGRHARQILDLGADGVLEPS